MVATTNGFKPTVPIVDFANFRPDADFKTRKRIAQELVAASKDVGFVYITNHGVPDDILAKAFEISKKFFDLPQEQKMKAPHPDGWQIHRGYSWPGRENVGVMTPRDNGMNDEALADARAVKDHRETYEIGSENNPEQPNVWPPSNVLPEWQPFMTSFYWTCWEHSKNILRALALGIGMEDEEYLLKLHSGHYNQLRLAHYPPIPAKEIEDGTKARIAPHTDWSTITLLFQDEVGGLQVEDPHHPGSFIDVDPVYGGLLMNVGDFAMRWSNDYLRSTRHRVLLPPLQDRFTGDDRKTRARYSIPYFIASDPDVVVDCLRVDDEHPPKYEPVTQRDYANVKAQSVY